MEGDVTVIVESTIINKTDGCHLNKTELDFITLCFYLVLY